MDDTTKKGSKNIVPSSESEEPAIAYRPIYDETKVHITNISFLSFFQSSLFHSKDAKIYRLTLTTYT